MAVGAGGVAPQTPQHEKWCMGAVAKPCRGLAAPFENSNYFSDFFFLHKMVYTKRYKRNYRKKSYRKKKSSGTNWGSVAKTALKPQNG